MEKLNARWEYGVLVGVSRRSNELMVVTKEGIEEVRSIRRIPVEHRWGEDCLGWAQWAPWGRYTNAEDADGDLPEGVPAEEPRGEPIRGIVFIETKEKAPREFYISKRDAEKYGYTRGCGGAQAGTEVWGDGHICLNAGRDSGG